VHPGYLPPMLSATNVRRARADKIAATPAAPHGKPIEGGLWRAVPRLDEASFVYGTELVIDGGFIAH